MLDNIPSHFVLHLTDDKQTQLANSLLANALLCNTINNTPNNTSTIRDIHSVKEHSFKVTKFVDGRGLACPQPLLKAKVALRSIEDDEAVYLVATDANSQYDIQAYANHAQLAVNVWQSEHQGEKIWHFLLSRY